MPGKNARKKATRKASRPVQMLAMPQHYCGINVANLNADMIARAFCVTCNSFGPWRKSYKEAEKDWQYHDLVTSVILNT